MALLPAEIERTYVRLWTHCDDHGRCVDNVKLIKAAIYPLHDDMTVEVVDEHIDRLVTGRHLIGYQIDGRKYLQVREWTKYQHPQRARSSPIPVADRSATRTRGSAEMERKDHGLEGRGDWMDTSANPTDASRPALPNPRRLEEARSVLRAIG